MSGPSTTRDRIIEATHQILAGEGPQGVSTRAVTAAARTQAPALYRLFGDKQGLLDAVAADGFTGYLRDQSRPDDAEGADPVEALRHGWDAHIDYGLANPHLYSIAYGDSRGGELTPAGAAAAEILQTLVRRVAAAGRLAVSEQRAVQLLHAAGCGTVFTLIATPPDQRDLGLSRDSREAVLQAILRDQDLSDPPGTSPASSDMNLAAAAVHLRALLGRDDTELTERELRLLEEWLDRLAHTPPRR